MTPEMAWKNIYHKYYPVFLFNGFIYLFDETKCFATIKLDYTKY